MMLPIGDGHSLHVETFGRLDGIPAVYLHGGPGSGCQPGHKTLFDPQRDHAVLIDQRGAGKSLPKGSRADNTTAHLIADMERVREALGLSRWLVVGGSWGATLALAYAQAHPSRVSGLVLRAVFLGTRRELEWAFLDAPRRFYPDLHEDFLSLLTPRERAHPLESYWRRILDPSPAVSAPAAWAWHDTERTLSQLHPGGTARLDVTALADPARDLPATAPMEAHYFSHDCFLAEGQLLANAPLLRDIPGIIVQGRYDLLCPPSTSAALAERWGNAEIRLVEAAGHALNEPAIHAATRAAIDDLQHRAPAPARKTAPLRMPRPERLPVPALGAG